MALSKLSDFLKKSHVEQRRLKSQGPLNRGCHRNTDWLAVKTPPPSECLFVHVVGKNE